MQSLLSDGVHDPTDPDVLQRLQSLHPQATEKDCLDEFPRRVGEFSFPTDITDDWLAIVRSAIASFAKGSAPGPSGLRPCLLQDLVLYNRRPGDLLSALALFTSTCLNGELPPTVAPMICAARLIPLRKKDGSVRPVAVGEVLRRLVGKCLLAHPATKDQITALLPHQCGVGLPDACPLIAQSISNAVHEPPLE